MRLNLGSGYTHLPGFARVDIDEKSEPDIVADIRDLSEIEDNSIDEIYTAHTLEHIFLSELFSTVRGFCRVLKPGGMITVIVPDVQTVAEDWIKNNLPSQYFEKIVMGATPSATPYMFHKQLFWKQKLERYLNIAGFININSRHKRETWELVSVAIKPYQ